MPATTARKPTAEELVKQKFPDAFVEDNGSWVHIMNRKTVTEICPHCRQSWTHKVVDLASSMALGSGNCAENARKNTAEALGLM